MASDVDATIVGLGAGMTGPLGGVTFPVIDLGLAHAEQTCGALSYYMGPSLQFRIGALLDHVVRGDRERRVMVFVDPSTEDDLVVSAVRAAMAPRSMLIDAGAAIVRDDEATIQRAWHSVGAVNADVVVLAASGLARERAVRSAQASGRGVDVLDLFGHGMTSLPATALPTGVTQVVVASWHDSLGKFGAAQLNDRYRARWNTGMTSAAWAGWMAVKSLFETAVRRGGDPAAAASPLTLDGMKFDGHKGRSLFFAASDHRLRHPLYITEYVGGKEESARVRETDAEPEESPASKGGLVTQGKALSGTLQPCAPVGPW
jgi:ABC-type branched-subunit amino acid transport system substrate-binding protein